MSLHFNKKRNKYEVRETVEGQRKYIGSFENETAAIEASVFTKITEAQRKETLENYQIKLEEGDGTIEFLKPLRVWWTDLRRRRQLKRAAVLLSPKTKNED